MAKVFPLLPSGFEKSLLHQLAPLVTLSDRQTAQSPAKYFLNVPVIFQTVSQDDFPDGSVLKPSGAQS